MELFLEKSDGVRTCFGIKKFEQSVEGCELTYTKEDGTEETINLVPYKHAFIYNGGDQIRLWIDNQKTLEVISV